MPFTIDEFRDLIKILEERPEWRAELRRLLLTEELLSLPQVMQKLAESQQRTQKHLEVLASRIEALAEQMEALTQRVDELTARVDALAEQIEILTRRVDTLAEQMTILTRRVEDLTVRVDALTARVEALAEQMEALTRRVDALAEQMEILTRRVDTLAEQMTILTRRVEDLTVRVDALTARVEALAEQMEALTRRVDALAEQMEILTRRVEDLTEQVSNLVEWQRGEAGRREGERYEQNLVKRAPMLFAGGVGGTTDAPRVQEQLSKWLRNLLDSERFLQPDEDPTLSDLIWWKREQVVVVETSLKVNGEDVTRALKRANTLRSAGVNATPVVIGEDWVSLEAREMAKERGVWWMIGGIPSEDFVTFRRLSPE